MATVGGRCVYNCVCVYPVRCPQHLTRFHVPGADHLHPNHPRSPFPTSHRTMVDAVVHEMLTTLQAATGAAALTAGGQAAGAPVAAGAAAVVGGGVPVGGQAAGAPVTAGVAALVAGRHADGAPVAAGAAALAAGGAAGDEKRLRDKERHRLASQAARDRNGPAINLRRCRPRAKVVKPVPARMPEERLQKRAADARRRRRVAAAAAGAAKKCRPSRRPVWRSRRSRRRRRPVWQSRGRRRPSRRLVWRRRWSRRRRPLVWSITHVCPPGCSHESVCGP